MKATLFYNDFSKELDIDINNKIGIIQEKILSLCSLLIYNIEYIELILDDKKYILGNNDDASYNLKFNELFTDIEEFNIKFII
jgi:hypothetical protein